MNQALPPAKLNVVVEVADNDEEPKTNEMSLVTGDSITFTITSDVFGKVDKKVIKLTVV